MSSNKKYKIIDHTADIGIKVKEKSLPDLFEAAILGTTDLLSGGLKVEPIKKRILSIEEENRETAFVTVLEEIIYLFQNELLLPSDCSVKIQKEYYKIKLRGNTVSAEEITEGIDIKAVTYHQLEIKKVNDFFQATVIFDI